MANTYKKEIDKIFVQPHYVEGELTLANVVTRVDYRIVGTSPKTDTSAFEGPITFYPSKPESADGYIVHEDLTSDDVLGWLPALTQEEEDRYYAEIDRLIASVESPTEELRPLPWTVSSNEETPN